VVDPIALAQTVDGRLVHLRPGLANRHGLITGATGTGKTVSLQVLAEGVSRVGACFLADVKGDLAGSWRAGHAHAETRKAADRSRPAHAGVCRQSGRVLGRVR